MKMSARRIFTTTERFFRFQLQTEMGIIQSPSLLFTNYFHSSASTHNPKDAKSQRFLRSKFNSSSFRDVDDALAFFNHIILLRPLPSIVQFCRFLSALVGMKQYHTVISLSRTIESLGISHDIYSLSILIDCFCRLHLVNFGFSILGKIIKFGLEPNTVTFTTLIKGLCIDGKINGAVDFFNDMVAGGYQPGVHTYTVIINALCKCGKTNVAIELLKGMGERGCEPNVVTYSAIVDALCKDKLVIEALDLFSQMRNKCISPNVVTYTCLIQGRTSFKSSRNNENNDPKVKPDVVTHNSLMDGFCLCNQMDEARKLFDHMGLWEAGRPGNALEVFKSMCSCGQQPNIITFSTILNGLCKQGNLDEALTLFKAMEKSRLKVNRVSYNILINGMCRAGRLTDAKELFSRLFEKGLQPDVYTYSIIIKGLCNEGLLDEAYKVFRGMEECGCLPNGCCYNVIIQGFLRHKDIPEATLLIDEMVDKGFSADATTFELVIHLLRNDDLILTKLRNHSKCSKGANFK
ncbi:hypothetical protein GH714_023519 [Hevea brasiliensis]|uniref:Pentacotripeptide-repeat region of PRORP domain-containing protein n=1 Tax=Hevea brasiliensis TaxID=3981 RepID=A0A6A6LDP0_HEVBR|nr:hypothetical protein GH714_023519 [Hevea brasiliensis]